MNIIQIDNWQEYLRDGDQFLKTAQNAHDKNSRAFSPVTIYNLVCMAIEKLIMAYLMERGDLADNHTMQDLVYSLKRHLDDLGEVEQRLLALDSFQEICDPEHYTIKIPSEQDVLVFLETAHLTRELLWSEDQ